MVIIGGYFGYQGLVKEEENVQYVTAVVERGTLVSSVSGSGQINVSDQIDIKPKVSGEVIVVYIKKGQEVKIGSLLVGLDWQDAQRAINDAEVALESAKVKLAELLAQPDAQSLLQAENALAQAERDLEKAKEDNEKIEMDAERILASAYEDGYNDVSTTFFKLSDYMEDLRDVLGTEQSAQEHISGYKLLLGSESLFIQKLLNDYNSALDLFNENFTFFREAYREDDRDTIYQLIDDTLETTKEISQALESARHMFDAIVVGSYKHFTIASIIDKMQSRIESDLSSIFSNISSLQRTIDTIDDTVQNTPNEIKDAELALESAQEKLGDKKLALEEVQAGADPLDIKAQQNTVAQKEAALLDAKEKLANHFVRAPFNGVIAEINVKTGDFVSSNTILITLMTQQQIAELTINEIDIAKVKLNQPATLVFDAVEELTLTGKVTDIASAASTNQGVVTYGITITLDTINELIKPGMTVDASIIVDRRTDIVFVPNSAIQARGDDIFVQVLEADDPNPVVKMIEVGISNDEVTEVISGLQKSEKVVTATLRGEVQVNTQAASVGSSFRIPGLGGGGGFRGGGGFISH